MSKSSRRKKRRKHKPPKTPQARLRAVAAALNRCEDAGMRMHLAGGAAFTFEGVVAQFKGHKWEARMFAGKGDVPRPDPDGMDD